MDKLMWGIISTGRISGVFANAVKESGTGEVLAVASRTQEAAERFGDQHNIPRRYGNYEALLEDPDVKAVYISTPHPMHAEWAVKAAEAGKHILCEKPLTLNYPEAMSVIDSARRHNVFLMEAFMYRCHPQTARLVELIREGAIGEVKLIQATFGFHAGFNPESRLFNNALGGGGILDVGCYPTSMARLIAGAAHGKPFEDPLEVKGAAHLGETGVDEYAVGILKFSGDIVAEVATAVALNLENVVRIFGSEGNILVPAPWFGSKAGEPARIFLHRNGEEKQEILVPNDASSYTHEANIVAWNIEKRQAPPPAMTWDDTLGNMKTLDMWRQAIGFQYEIEKPDSNYPTIDRRPLTVRQGGNMKYGRIPGLEKQVSRIVMGVVGGGIAHTSIMFDEFFRYGGNCFDTAYIYGGGMSEKLLGQWIKNRGVRDQVVILDKGAHTPHCNPTDLTNQLFTSLERLGTDYVDIYMMHRDNEDIPVGEFIDVLNEHLRAGRIKTFGVSNWTIRRIEEANEYARANGLVGISAVSNNFSLARMVEPVWEGCLASSDPESIAWFTKTQMPLMAWSSLARGFFAHGHPAGHTDPDMIRCWHSEDNIRRAEKLMDMAKEKGVHPVSLALAYVLCQAFPTFALVGPANLEELGVSMKGLDITLTPEELRWLNLEL